jgi:UDPglucose 6-dehydrogenase
MPRSKEILPNVRWAHSALDACRKSDIVVIMTEWKEFGEIDPAELKDAMSGNVVVDFRNLFLPEKITSVGLNYFPLGLMPSFAL